MTIDFRRARERDAEKIVQAQANPAPAPPPARPSSPPPVRPPQRTTPLGTPAPSANQAPKGSPYQNVPDQGWSGVSALKRGLPRMVGAVAGALWPDPAGSTGDLGPARWRWSDMRNVHRPNVHQSVPELPSFVGNPDLLPGKIVLPIIEDDLTWQPLPLMLPGPTPDAAPTVPGRGEAAAPLPSQGAVGAAAVGRSVLNLSAPDLAGQGRYAQHLTVGQVRLSVSGHPNGLLATLSGGRVRERKNERKRDVKMGRYGKLLMAVNATYGAYTEAVDAYDAFAQNLWYRLPSGRYIRAVAFLDRYEAGLAWLRGDAQLDIAGFVADFVLTQTMDRVFAKYGQVWQQYAKRLGYDRPIGLQAYTHFLRKGDQDVWSVYGSSLGATLSGAREWVLPSAEVGQRLLW